MMRGYGEALTERKRRKIIIDFIDENYGCIAEDVCRKVENTIGRKKVFKILKDLKREHIVNTKIPKPNSREIMLFLNTSNLSIAIPDELDKFENIFIHFVDNLVKRNRGTINILISEIEIKIDECKKDFKKKSNSKLTPDEFDRCMDADIHTSLEELSIYLSTFVKAIELLTELFRIYSIRFMIDWSHRIRYKESLNELLEIVLDEN